MKLYHFTDPNRLPSIETSGINRGDVPITMAGGYNAPWFTTDPTPSNQGWAGGGYKTSLRLTVDIPDADPKLKKWTDIIEEQISNANDPETKKSLKQWYDILNSTGGNGQEYWYIYQGTVPFEWVVEKKLMDESDEAQESDTAPSISVGGPISTEISITPRQIYTPRSDKGIQDRQDLAPSRLRKRKQ